MINNASLPCDLFVSVTAKLFISTYNVLMCCGLGL